MGGEITLEGGGLLPAKGVAGSDVDGEPEREAEETTAAAMRADSRDVMNGDGVVPVAMLGRLLWCTWAWCGDPRAAEAETGFVEAAAAAADWTASRDRAC